MEQSLDSRNAEQRQHITAPVPANDWGVVGGGGSGSSRSNPPMRKELALRGWVTKGVTIDHDDSAFNLVKKELESLGLESGLHQNGTQWVRLTPQRRREAAFAKVVKDHKLEAIKFYDDANGNPRLIRARVLTYRKDVTRAVRDQLPLLNGVVTRKARILVVLPLTGPTGSTVAAEMIPMLQNQLKGEFSGPLDTGQLQFILVVLVAPDPSSNGSDRGLAHGRRVLQYLRHCRELDEALTVVIDGFGLRMDLGTFAERYAPQTVAAFLTGHPIAARQGRPGFGDPVELHRTEMNWPHIAQIRVGFQDGDDHILAALRDLHANEIPDHIPEILRGYKAAGAVEEALEELLRTATAGPGLRVGAWRGRAKEALQRARREAERGFLDTVTALTDEIEAEWHQRMAAELCLTPTVRAALNTPTVNGTPRLATLRPQDQASLRDAQSRLLAYALDPKGGEAPLERLVIHSCGDPDDLKSLELDPEDLAQTFVKDRNVDRVKVVPHEVAGQQVIYHLCIYEPVGGPGTRLYATPPPPGK